MATKSYKHETHHLFSTTPSPPPPLRPPAHARVHTHTHTRPKNLANNNKNSQKNTSSYSHGKLLSGRVLTPKSLWMGGWLTLSWICFCIQSSELETTNDYQISTALQRPETARCPSLPRAKGIVNWFSNDTTVVCTCPFLLFLPFLGSFTRLIHESPSVLCPWKESPVKLNVWMNLSFTHAHFSLANTTSWAGWLLSQPFSGLNKCGGLNKLWLIPSSNFFLLFFSISHHLHIWC